MSVLTDHINELKASEAFGRQAPVFDELYGADSIIQYKRERVRQHILARATKDDLMLELNCGSGEDAIFFAQQGFTVHATDIADGMLNVMRKKVPDELLERITVEQCSFTELQMLNNCGPFDYVYSNFGGLNCTSQLDLVLDSLYGLLKPGGTATLVIISKFCLWESLLLFKGKFKTAFRRFFSSKGRTAHVEGKYFKCWYYSPSFVQKHLREKFELTGLEGLCTIVPPSYIEHFGEKHPKLFRFLKKKEDGLKSKWPFRSMGDYFIISLKKR